MLKTIIAQVKQYKKASIAAVVCTMLEVFMEVSVPYLMSKIIDLGIQQGNMNNVIRYGAMMLVAVIMSLILGIVGGRLAAYASTGVACNLRDALFENIQTFSFSNIDKFSTAGLVTRLTTDVMNIQNAYQMVIRMCVRAPITLISALFMAFMINTRISIIFVVAIIFLVICLGTIIRIAMPAFTQLFQKYDDLNASVQENITGIRVVKAFVREDFETTKFKKAVDALYNLSVKAEKAIILNNPSMMLTTYACIIAISWFGANMIVGGTLTTGELTSLFSYVMNILMSLMMLSMVFVMITQSLASVRRIVEVINETSDIKSPSDAVMTVKDGSIDFENVSFGYTEGKDKEVLKEINLHINAGETIGILGGTGSAKTSLVSLISRLYDATSGSVKVGGKDVKAYDLDTLRNEVAVVLQKNELFSGTVLDNLRWGDENATEEDCKRVCEMACADEFIQNFPDKYHTYIEQGGTNVSGGQKQRLCIARALLKKPKILILDDSTSAVDTATDSRIRKAFREEIPNTTKLIIAQRINSIQDADRIIVLDDGKINGFGSHETLLESNEIYRTVYESQLKGSGDFDKEGM